MQLLLLQSGPQESSKALESYSLEENPILPLLRFTNGNLCLRHQQVFFTVQNPSRNR